MRIGFTVRCSKLWRTAAGLSLAAALPLGAQTAPKPTPSVMRKVARGFAVSSTVNMRAYVPAGALRVRVWDRDSVHIVGAISDAASLFGGGDASHVKFGIEPARTGDTRLPEGDLTVTVPRRAGLWVKMTNGTIDAEGTEGSLELYTVGGSVVVRGTAGVLSVETIDAPITVEGSRGDIRVRGGKGAVTMRDVTGTASVATVSGKVSLFGAVPECRVETIGGDIAVSTTTLRGAMLELQTHSGAMLLDVNPRALPQLDLTSRTGTVTPHSSTGSAKEGRIVARSFRGSITVQAVKPASVQKR